MLLASKALKEVKMKAVQKVETKKTVDIESLERSLVSLLSAVGGLSNHLYSDIKYAEEALVDGEWHMNEERDTPLEITPESAKVRRAMLLEQMQDFRAISEHTGIMHAALHECAQALGYKHQWELRAKFEKKDDECCGGAHA